MAVYKSCKPTKDGRAYYFRIKYKDLFGNKHDYSSQKYLHRKDAVEAESVFRASKVIDSKSIANPTFGDVFNEYIIDKQKKSKMQTVKKDYYFFEYLSAVRNVRINDFDLPRYKKLYAYVYDLPFTANYRTRILRLLKRLIIYSAKFYNTSDSLVKFIEPVTDCHRLQREMDFYTYEEFQKFISVVDDSNYHALFDVLYFTGIRIGEAIGLQWKDVDFKNSTISINKTATTKLGEFYTLSTPKTKNSIRVLPISKKLLHELKSVQETHASDVDYSDDYFVFGAVRPFPESTIQKRKNHYCDLASLRHIRIHDFRHSFASFMIHNGASIMLVSKYLGHSSTSITLDIYTHLYNSEMTKMIQSIDDFI